MMEEGYPMFSQDHSTIIRNNSRVTKTGKQQRTGQIGSTNTLMISLLVFISLVGAGVWAAYTYGDGYISINGAGLESLTFWEVTAGVAIGIIGAFIGILAGIAGVLIGLAAAFLSILLALAGIATGLFITIGVLAGPILLLAAIIMLMRRSSAHKADTPALPPANEAASAIEA